MNRTDILADIAAGRIGVTDQGVWWYAVGPLTVLHMAWIESVLRRGQAAVSDRYETTPVGQARILALVRVQAAA